MRFLAPVSLPKRIGDLTSSLNELNLGSCDKLVSLPDRFADLVNLKNLHLTNTPAGSNMPAALREQLVDQGCEGEGWGWLDFF